MSHYHNLYSYHVSPDIAGEISFVFTPFTLTINDTLLAECVVNTQADLSNPSTDITWFGPDGTVFSSLQDVVFSEVTTAGIRQQEARLSLPFPQFSPDDFGEYSCIAAITSDSVPGVQTSVFQSVQIPTAPGKSPDMLFVSSHTHTMGMFVICTSSPGDIFQIPVPIYLIGEDSRPLAGQAHFFNCIVNSPSLSGDDMFWIAPDNAIISGTSGRIRVGTISQGRNGRSVRRLTFNPLTTDDSGPYACVSPDGTAIQTLTVDGMSHQSCIHTSDI